MIFGLSFDSSTIHVKTLSQLLSSKSKGIPLDFVLEVSISPSSPGPRFQVKYLHEAVSSTPGRRNATPPPSHSSTTSPLIPPLCDSCLGPSVTPTLCPQAVEHLSGKQKAPAQLSVTQRQQACNPDQSLEPQAAQPYAGGQGAGWL